MSGIHSVLLLRAQALLQQVLIDDPTAADPEDPAIAGVVMIGPLQGDPDPDTARISVTLHECDPDEAASANMPWRDEVVMVEIGGAVTSARRFTCATRCLLENTQEELLVARDIAGIIASRIERALLGEHFVGVVAGDGEYCSRGPMSESLTTQVLQGGGPPDAYDFAIKIRFDVWTTKTGVNA